MRDQELQKEVDQFLREHQNMDYNSTENVITKLIHRIEDLEDQLNQRGQYGIDWE